MSHGFKFPLPENVVKLIEKSQRAEIGLKTIDEKVAAAEVQSERDLHRQIANLLRLRGIFFIESRMDRKTTTQVGCPDFLFCVLVKDFDKTTQRVHEWPVAIGFELKVAGRPLSQEQKKVFNDMTARPNAWKPVVVRSVDDALSELKRLGL